MEEAATPKILRGAKATKRWSPKEWRPEYTAIVALSCTGLSNEAVGKHFNYSKQQISNILNQPEAIKIREVISTNLLETSKLSMADRMIKLQSKALERVETVLNDEEMAHRSPMQIFDRAFKFLQASSPELSPENSPTGNSTTNIQNNIVLNEALANKLIQGLDLAQRVKDVHANVTATSVEPKSLTGLTAG